MANTNHGAVQQAAATEPIKFLSKEEAKALEGELYEEYRFGQQQLIEISGHSCAMAIAKNYEPTIYYPKRSCKPIFLDFTVQCEKMDIPFLSYLPAEVQLINDAYNLIIDAVLGLSDEAGLKELYTNILATMKHVKIPIISIDVPSGWDVEKGNTEGINPAVLVSLAAPKKCATQFSGKFHFLAGRYLPDDLQKKYELNPPDYPGTDCIVQL
ncbi:yjeF N-terminal domain-containing 3 isoform X2 [Stegostoma tigrinum]|uniref:yjeF N-terminal domain-containing 3 isoform X2 n=1 Tax=Stegostoma tigrinum TaxID=3053191 RepID=UPI00202B768F|nr:yjeF N-terminal domain-containing 3 isoform X2 [Stegostoma tigrinum]